MFTSFYQLKILRLDYRERMHRRTALTLLGLGGLAALGAGFAVGSQPGPVPIAPRGVGHPRPAPRPYPAAFPLPPHFVDPKLPRSPAPYGTITALPGDAPTVAITIDDGNSTEVVAAYTKLSFDSGLRLTFFLNGSRPSWTDNAPALRELIAAGQVQLGNHTWSHPDLRKLSRGQVVDELQRNHDFIGSTYGVDARPYFRPPYGNHNDFVDDAAASIGYTVPVLWYGSFSDSTEITDGDLMASAQAWLLPQHIVIGHANYPTVTRHFDEIIGIIRSRGLVPVTLDDVFSRP
jgi:peptidoglycan/xylan/chitin deacetylase (PgdA/CDA1 family)